MTPADEQVIVSCAERCERSLLLESTYLRAGDFVSAAACAELAEFDSYLAFSRATGGRVNWVVIA